MFGLMTVAAHEAAIEQITAAARAANQVDRDIGQRALDAERSITASLRAENAELKPAADKWNAAHQRRKSVRDAAKAAAANVPAKKRKAE